MKKFIAFLAALTLLTGCDLGKKLDNTPTKKVENFLNKYQTLDEDVLTSLDNVISLEEDFNADQKDKYRDIIKNNYQKMTYKIKDEEIDGDSATVTVEIEVLDYSKVLSDADNYKLEHPEEFENDKSKFIDYQLEQLEKEAEKVKYTMDLSLTKIDDEWILDDLSKENEAKLNGIYSY